MRSLAPPEHPRRIQNHVYHPLETYRPAAGTALLGQRAVVTGVIGQVGFSIAAAMRDAGAAVLAVSRSASRDPIVDSMGLDTTRMTRLSARAIDLPATSSVDALRGALEACPPVDQVVAAAAVAGHRGVGRHRALAEAAKRPCRQSRPGR